LQIKVRDTGIGIRKEDRDKIFLILGKLEATASINTSGVGLGLSTCKKLAEALKGDIFLVDDEDQDQQSLLIDTSSCLKLKKT
jgi:signal transduction histidine kinase